MNAKRIIAAILAAVVVLSLVACGGKKNDEVEILDDTQEQLEETVKVPDEEADAEKEDEKEPVLQQGIESENKKPQAKPETKPEAKPETKPETTPEAKPEAKPEVKPEEKPQQQATTVGQTLLADFKAKANSAKSANDLAEAIVTNPIIAFSGATMPVEPGFLAGFGETEIKGFKEGAMFGPVIGSIPFVGYVFVLEDGTNVSDFISTLKSNADLRWNICVEAEEMVAGSSGNKVFFVMCPKSFETEE